MKADFDSLINLYSTALTGFCISLCSSISDAEDLFQDTWLKAMKNYKKYDSSKPFEKWLFTICINTYKDKLKLFYNKRKKSFINEEEKNAFLNSLPDKKAENENLYLELRVAVSTLPKKLKVVLVLFYYKDYSIKEISGVLNIPEGTVKSRLKKAKTELKRRLNDE